MTNKEQRLITLTAQFKQLGIDQQIDYEKFYLYSLITHSTAIEGSTVTEVENQLLFDEGISAKGRTIAEQLMNLDLKTAYEQSIAYAKSHTDITIDLLKQLSSIVMRNTGSTYNTALGTFSSTNGDLRLLNVTAGVGGRSYMNYTKIPIKLAEFCELLNQQRKNADQLNLIQLYILSFDAHFHLVTIHPWADGNGRMSRLLMNQLQFEFGLIPTKIDRVRKAEYIEALIATRESDDMDIFRNYMLDEHIRNLELMIHNYQISIDQESVSTINVPVNVPVNITERQKQILHLIQANSTVTIQQLSEVLNVSGKTIRRDIDSLKQLNVLVRTGSDKKGEWQIIEPTKQKEGGS
ncbi:MAG: Fic family protein [Parabacteroides sp.]|nr:Fic family protein [Parabacteroides sp.]